MFLTICTVKLRFSSLCIDPPPPLRSIKIGEGVPSPIFTEGRGFCTQAMLYGHPLNMDTSLLRTVCFLPGEKKALTFSLNLTRLLYGHPVNTDTFLQLPQCPYLKRFDCISTKRLCLRHNRVGFIFIFTVVRCKDIK